MVPRKNSVHAPNRKQIHCSQGTLAHQLPLLEREHGGQVADLHHRISLSILMPLCCPTCLQIPTSVHLDLSSSSELQYSSPSALYTQFGFWTILNLQAAVHSLTSTQLPSLWFLHTEVPWPHPIHLLRSCHVLNDKNCP